MRFFDFKRKIESIQVDGSSSAIMYLVFKTSAGLKVRLMDVEHRCQDEMKQFYLKGLAHTLSTIQGDSNADFEFQKLSTADDRNCEAFEYDLAYSDDLVFLKNIFENGEYERFASVHDDIRELYGYVSVLGTSSNKILLFKKHMQVNTFAPKKLCIFSDENRFKQFKKPLIRLDADSDIIFLDATLIVRRLPVLERYMGFHDVIIKEAQKSVSTSKINEWVKDIHKFDGWISTDVSFARKLVRIQRTSPVLRNVSLSQVIDFIRARPKFSERIKIIQDGDDQKLEIKSKAAGGTIS